MVIDNAITYSPQGSTVTVTAEQTQRSVTISVRDAGMGISEEDMKRLFKKFFRSEEAMRAHTEGLGIGLYLSRTILRKEGGDLWAVSKGRGKGSTFFLKMPMAR
jgi:signal transduction histidine kinase